MLVLKRAAKQNDKSEIVCKLPGGQVIVITAIKGTVTLGIDAPADVKVWRGELLEKVA